MKALSWLYFPVWRQFSVSWVTEGIIVVTPHIPPLQVVPTHLPFLGGVADEKMKKRGDNKGRVESFQMWKCGSSQDVEVMPL